MRTIIRTNFDNRSHNRIVAEYCSEYKARVPIAPRSFERLYTDSNEVVIVDENEPQENVLEYLFERSDIRSTVPRRIQYVVVVPVLVSYADGEPVRMWGDDSSAEPPHRT
ncbi:MAG: hypothetical protein ACLGSD_01780 [Acidobacteriota bacterium]